MGARRNVGMEEAMRKPPKGYRMLKLGEKIKNGDMVDCGNGWELADGAIGMTLQRFTAFSPGYATHAQKTTTVSGPWDTWGLSTWQFADGAIGWPL
jgi:hypothetical protein